MQGCIDDTTRKYYSRYKRGLEKKGVFSMKKEIRDKKHRIMSTAVLLISIALSVGIFFLFLMAGFSSEVSGLIAFSIAISINIIYQYAYFFHMEEDITKVNALTQVWFGVIIIFSCSLILILHVFFGVGFENALIFMSALVITTIFLTIKKFDEYIESKV